MKRKCACGFFRRRCLRLLRCLIYKLIKIYYAMAIRTRSELKNHFQSGHLPTQQHFHDMIESMLNRKDDNFFGQWKSGTRYCPCDVVFFNKSFYVAKPAPGDAPCHETDNRAAAERDAKSFCSTTPPDQDTAKWGQLELEVRDNDWLVDKDKPDIMYAGIWGRIGMGTDEPKARVDITVAGKGAFLFDPGYPGNAPEFAIRDATCDPDDLEPEVRQSVTKAEAYWYTNVPGYAFRKLPKPHEDNESDPECDLHPELLMFITTDPHQQKPAVGIGLDAPEAALDTFDEGTGRILLRPGGNANPELLVVNLRDGKETYFKITVEPEATIFRNPKGKKFIFREIQESIGPLDECSNEATLVAITRREDDEGRMEAMVGIGTENPQAHLEVTDNKSGRILLSLNKTNPALAIVNMRPKTNQENYMTLGVNNKRGVFVTDSPKGFEFRTGNPCGKNENELNIDQQGKILLSIDDDAKVGIGKHPDPQYELDVHGEIKSFGAYLETHKDSMDDTRRLDGKNVLDKLKTIHPVSFSWSENAWRGKGSEARQIGLLGHEVAEQFEELVKNLDDGNYAVSYQGMVAVLLSAIKELDKEVKDLRRELDKR